MANIEFESIEISNFMSYGEGPTIITLSNLGQCFLWGTITDSIDSSKSNGSGKSAITQALLWCLSGKTLYNTNPGNKICNHFTKNDAKVTINFKNGSQLTRIRGRSGHTELLYSKDGKSIIDTTLSTTTNQQAALFKELGFDFDIFCGSVFFSKYNKSWLSMGDQARKNTLERIMGIDRLTSYAETAKEKRDKCTIEFQKLQSKREIYIEQKTLIESDIERTKESQQASKARTQQQIKLKLDSRQEILEKISQHTNIDIDALTAKWSIVSSIESKIVELKSTINNYKQQYSSLESETRAHISEINNNISTKLAAARNITYTLRNERQEKLMQLEKECAAQRQALLEKRLLLDHNISNLKSKLHNANNKIDLYQKMDGKICLECEQEIPHTHVEHKIKPFVDEVQKYSEEIDNSQLKLAGVTGEIKQLSDNLDVQKKAINEEYESRISKAEMAIPIIENEKEQLLVDANTKFKSRQSEISKQIAAQESVLTSITSKLEQSKPKYTISEAKAINAQHTTYQQQLLAIDNDITNLEKGTDPYKDILLDLDTKLEATCKLLTPIDKQCNSYGTLETHLGYIYNAYSDRRKIKSYLIAEYLPFFNSRLHYYLEKFELDIKLEVTESLTIQSNLWGYDFESGGERKRTDLSFNLAVFDLHNGIYGQQSNLLVLDEPDDGLDEPGVQSLINIVKNDLSSKFESILIISHKQAMKAVFPRHIKVVRTNRLSYVEEQR